jgi:CHAT domain-containing protein/nitrous oxidase accessory protein NosD
MNGMKRLPLVLLLAILSCAYVARTETLRVPEDHPTIQAAIDGADLGDVIDVSGGLYRENIVIEKAIEITGAGATETFICGENGAPVVDIKAGTVLLERLRIGRAGEQTPGVRWDFTGQDHSADAGVIVRNTGFALLRDCDVQSNSYGVLLLDHARLVMSACSVSANWEGVSARENSDVLLQECAISRNLRCGADIDDHAQAVIAGSTIDGNDIIGVQVESHAAVTIDKTSISGPGSSGVWTGGESRLTLVGCILGDASEPFTRYGLHGYGEAVLEARNTTIQNAQNAGILLEDASALRGYEATIRDCEEDGVTATDASVLQMIGCTITRSGEAGIRLMDQASARLSWSNVCDSAWGIGLLGESSITAVACRFEDNDNHLELHGSSYAAIHQCQVLGGRVGIELSDSAAVEATDSALVACKGNGLVATDSATAYISGCRLLRNFCGILLEGAAELTMLGSQLQENEYGIYLSEAGCVEGADGDFRGTVSGRGNAIEGSSTNDMCPAVGTAPWPDDFLSARVLLVPSDYATIQEAVDAARPGDTVRLAEGDYDERVSIDKSITLEGAGCTRTLIHKRYMYYSDQDYPAALGVSADAGTVALRDLGVTDCGDCVSAALGNGASLQVENVRFTQLGDCSSRGLVLEGGGAAFLDSCFFYGQRSGVVATDVVVSVRDSTFGALWDQNAVGLEVRGGAHVMCTSNTFFGHTYGLSAPPPFGGMATGSDNYIDRRYYEAWPVPGTQDSPWPAGVIAEGYTEAIDGLRLAFLDGFTVAVGGQDYPQAIERFQDVLTGVRQWPNPLLEARALFFLALVLERSGSSDQAAPLYLEAIRISELFGQSVYEVALASHYFPSWESLPTGQALRDFLHEGRPLRQALSMYTEAQGHIDDGDFEEAVDVLREALELLEAADECGGFYEDLLWLSRLELGIAYEGLGARDEAVEAYLAAVSIIEQVRADLSSEELKVFWYERTQRVYERLIDLLYRMGEGTSAFPYAERCRARTFLDTLYGGGVSPDQLISPELGVSSGAVNVAAIDASIIAAQELLLPNEAVLEYMATENGVYLWVITSSDGISDPIYVEYPRQELMRDVIALRQDLEALDPDTSSVHTLLGSLYEQLVQPGLDLLGDEVDTLVLIPSGPLWYVPFSSLAMTDQSKIQLEGGIGLSKQYRPTYLVEGYTLAFLPSLASLPTLMSDESEASRTSLLALANPELTATQVGDLDLRAVYFDELEEAARAFALCYAGSDESVHTDADAEEPRAYSQDGTVGVEVYACHGSFNPYVPLQSKLLLGPGSDSESAADGSPRVPDGDYYAWEAMLTDHQGTELVVLTACETLLPAFQNLQGMMGVLSGQDAADVELNEEQLERIVIGDEVVGLARAFLSSGAQSVMGTLWQANPRAIEQLLVTLCECHQQGMTWAEALQESQRQLLSSQYYSDVWFWAPYQLIGRWR